MELEELATSLSSLDDDSLVSAIASALEERPSVCQALTDWMIDGDEQKAYLSTKMFTTRRVSGVVKSFNPKSGYGFIKSEGCTEAFGCDVFVHHAQIQDAVVNSQVNFVIFLNKDRKPHAYDVRVDDSPMPVSSAYKGAGKRKLGYGAPAEHDYGFTPQPQRVNSWEAWESAGAVPNAFQGGRAFNGGKGTVGTVGKGTVGKGKVGTGKLQQKQAVKPTPETAFEVPGVTDRRWNGVFKSFNDKTGFGFIECEEIKDMYGGDVFVHRAQVAEFPPQVGMAVEFGVFLNKDEKPSAKDIIPEGASKLASKLQKQGVKQTPETMVEVPGVTDERWHGFLKSYNEKTGFGFIECADLKDIYGADVFVHRAQVTGFSPDAGIELEFGVFLNKDEKPQAKDIAAAASSGPPAKRQRQ